MTAFMIVLPTAWSLLVYGVIRMVTGIPAERMWAFWRGCAVGSASVTAAALIGGLWAFAAGSAINVLVSLAMWWLSRRKRKDRARKLLGAKSRALRDALVRRARELSVPRPVLAPGGAR